MTFRRVRAIDSTFERYGYWLPIFFYVEVIQMLLMMSPPLGHFIDYTVS